MIRHDEEGGTTNNQTPDLKQVPAGVRGPVSIRCADEKREDAEGSKSLAHAH
jgi:hypothetical protein